MILMIIIIQFIENTVASLHASWYTMLFFTVLPMVLSVPRHLSLVYLAVYAISGACVVQFGLPESTTTQQQQQRGGEAKRVGKKNGSSSSSSSGLHSKMKTTANNDDKTHSNNNIFRLIKLQDL